MLFETYYILTRRYGKSASQHSSFQDFARQTRDLAIYVAIKNKIQHLAKLTRLGKKRIQDITPNVCTHLAEAQFMDSAVIFANM